MDNKTVASKLVKMAKSIIASKISNLEENDMVLLDDGHIYVVWEMYIENDECTMKLVHKAHQSEDAEAFSATRKKEHDKIVTLKELLDQIIEVK